MMSAPKIPPEKDTDAQVICLKKVKEKSQAAGLTNQIYIEKLDSSYIAIFDGIQQARARAALPVPSRTRPGSPYVVSALSLQNYPRNDGATPAACARSVDRYSRSSRRPTGRTSRVPASSRVVSPWGAPRRGRLIGGPRGVLRSVIGHRCFHVLAMKTESANSLYRENVGGTWKTTEEASLSLPISG
jgi:hypothetical protein